MNSFSSIDYAAEIDVPISGRFFKPVRQIKFHKHGNKDKVESALDTAKENLCPCKVRYIVLKTGPNELFKDVGNVESFCNGKPEELSVTVNEAELAGIEDLKTKLLKKLFDLSAVLQESMIPINTGKKELLLKHCDKFLSSKSDILAFVESDYIKFIYRCYGDRNAVAEECETIKKETICEAIRVVDRKDLVKLELDRANIQNEATKIEIGEDCIKLEGFPLDILPTKLKVYKAMQVNRTLTETLTDDEATLLMKESVAAFCNEMIRLQIPNKDLFLWRVEGNTLYAVGRNEKIAKTVLEAIRSCTVIIEDDFSALTLPDESHMIKYEDSLQRDFQDEVVLNVADLAKVFVTTIIKREEQARFRMKRFKSEYTLETKDVACSPEKMFYLEASQGDFKAEPFSRNSLVIEKCPMKESLKITAYQSDLSAVAQKTVCRQSLGMNNDEVRKRFERTVQVASERFRCKCKLSDTQGKVLVREGRIEEQKVDVIVNSVSGDLDIEVPNVNSITFSIANAAGSSAGESLRQKYPNGAKIGEVAVGDSGNLKCKELYHVVLGRFPMNPKTDKYLVSISEMVFTDEIEKRISLDEEEGKTCLIEHPKWLCKWKLDVVGETEEEIQDLVKMINTLPL